MLRCKNAKWWKVMKNWCKVKRMDAIVVARAVANWMVTLALLQQLATQCKMPVSSSQLWKLCWIRRRFLLTLSFYLPLSTRCLSSAFRVEARMFNFVVSLFATRCLSRADPAMASTLSYLRKSPPAESLVKACDNDCNGKVTRTWFHMNF